MARKRTGGDRPAKVTGGSHTLADRGLVQILAVVTAEQKARIAAAAALDGRALNHWCGEQLARLADERLAAAARRPSGS